MTFACCPPSQLIASDLSIVWLVPRSSASPLRPMTRAKRISIAVWSAFCFDGWLASWWRSAQLEQLLLLPLPPLPALLQTRSLPLLPMVPWPPPLHFPVRPSTSCLPLRSSSVCEVCNGRCLVQTGRSCTRASSWSMIFAPLTASIKERKHNMAAAFDPTRALAIAFSCFHHQISLINFNGMT